MTSAGLVLAGTFSVFALVGGRKSGGSQIVDVGVGLALGILVALQDEPGRSAAGRAGYR